MTPIREWPDVTQAVFREIRQAAEPTVIRGLARDWPIVQASDPADYLRRLGGGLPVQYMRGEPEIDGRLHYGDDGRGRNFERVEGRLADLLDALESAAGADRPRSLALQGMPANRTLPDFAATHLMPLLPVGVGPRLWIGNAAKVAIHHDPSENIAVVAAGRRRFTLFPPEQVGNLYMGPFHETPAGVQVSLVHLTEPDLERFPRFARAMQAALVAELGPGDALYIPYHWYHHVEALESFNVLVNYWWDAAPMEAGSPWDAMMHGLVSLRTLPADQRRAWRAMFDHYVFQLDGDPVAHLPPDRQGALQPPTPQGLARMKAALKAKL